MFIVLCAVTVATTLAMALTGCTVLEPAAQPSRPLRFGTLLLDEPFDGERDWTRYDSEGASLAIVDGRYVGRLTLANRYLWGQSSLRIDDSITEVTVTMLNDQPGTLYGLMCRLSTPDSSRGYAFLLRANGLYSIRRGDGTDFAPLVQGQASSLIRRGIGQNRIRAVCDGDRLALYINGAFVAETRDSRYSSGSPGVIMGQQGNGEAQISFDNFRVWQMGEQ